MSTKIHCAYRIPTKKINHFLEEIADSVLDLTAEYIHGLQGVIVDSKDYKEKLAEFKTEHSQHFFWKYLEMYHLRPASRSFEWSMFDVDSSVNLYIDGSKTYCVLYLNVQDAIIPEYAEEYSYWNNTDRPDDISSGRWNRRGNNWERVAFENPIMLTHNVISYRNYTRIPELEKRFLNNC